jgi:hypothetical protein
MNLPGFTAEASLTKGDADYYAADRAFRGPAVLQPAHSLTYFPHGEVPHLDHPGVPNCLKWVCKLGQGKGPDNIPFLYYHDCMLQSAHCY